MTAAGDTQAVRGQVQDEQEARTSGYATPGSVRGRLAHHTRSRASVDNSLGSKARWPASNAVMAVYEQPALAAEPTLGADYESMPRRCGRYWAVS